MPSKYQQEKLMRNIARFVLSPEHGADSLKAFTDQQRNALASFIEYRESIGRFMP